MGHSKTRTNLAHKLKSKRSARIGVLILIGRMLALITEAQFEPIEATVVRGIDGDTIRVRVRGKVHTVRLIGVDTPETVHPTKTALEGKTVTLEADPTGDTRDRYGRLLRYVHLDGQNFNARLISEGYAHAIRGFRYSKRASFIRLEEAAKRLGKGLWSPP